MPPKDAKIDHMIDEINALGRGLTAWEEDFMIDMTELWDAKRALSEKQLEIVDRIYTERVI